MSFSAVTKELSQFRRHFDLRIFFSSRGSSSIEKLNQAFNTITIDVAMSFIVLIINEQDRTKGKKIVEYIAKIRCRNKCACNSIVIVTMVLE